MNPTAKHIWNTLDRLERENALRYRDMAEALDLSEAEYVELRERCVAPPLLSLLKVSEKFNIALTSFTSPTDNSLENPNTSS